MNTTQSSPMRAIFFALMGFTSWSIGDSLVKLATESQAPFYEIMGMTSLGGMAIIFTISAMRGKLRKLKPTKPAGLLLAGLLYLLNYWLGLTALTKLPIASYYTILFLAPALIVLLAAWLLKEELTLARILAIAGGFIGVVIAIEPSTLLHSGLSGKNMVGNLYALGAMVSLALLMFVMRVLSRHEGRECLAFYPRITSLVMAFGGSMLIHFVPLSNTTLALGLGSGVFGSLGWLCLAESYRLAPASTVSPFHYSQIVSGALLGFLIWGDKPSVNVLIGAVIIILSGVYIVSNARRGGTMPKTLAENP